MKKLLILTLTIFSLFFLANCGDKKVEEKPEFMSKYNPKANPEDNLNYAIKIAKEYNKRILLLVGGDWCPWCRALDVFLYKDNPKVGKYLNDNFVLVKVYYGKENYNTNFLSGFPRLTATPHFYVLESDGSQLSSQNSEILEKGRSYDKVKVMSFLQKWKKH